MSFKKLFFIVSLFLSAHSFAQNSETLPFNGQTSLATELFGVKTHTEYRYEDHPDTCYREVFSHYDNVCREVPEQHCSYEPRTSCRTVSGACRTFQGECRTHCHDVRGERRCNTVCPPAQTRCEPDRQECSTSSERVCRTTYRTECNQVARYRTESYSCTRTVRIPYEVFDYNIEAKVDVVVAKLPQGLEVNENLSIELVDEEVVLKLSQDNAKLVAVISSKNKHESLSEQVKSIHFQIEVEVYNAEEITKDVEGVIEKVSYENDHLVMTLRDTKIVSLDSIHFKLTQDRFLFRDRALYNQKIPQTAILTKELEGKKILKVNLPALLNKEFRSRKHSFELNFSYLLGEGFITENKDIKLSIEKKFIQKL